MLEATRDKLLKLSAADLEEIEKLASKTNVSSSELIRQIIKGFLTDIKGEKLLERILNIATEDIKNPIYKQQVKEWPAIEVRFYNHCIKITSGYNANIPSFEWIYMELTRPFERGNFLSCYPLCFWEIESSSSTIYRMRIRKRENNIRVDVPSWGEEAKWSSI